MKHVIVLHKHSFSAIITNSSSEMFITGSNESIIYFKYYLKNILPERFKDQLIDGVRNTDKWIREIIINKNTPYKAAYNIIQLTDGSFLFEIDADKLIDILFEEYNIFEYDKHGPKAWLTEYCSTLKDGDLILYSKNENPCFLMMYTLDDIFERHHMG